MGSMGSMENYFYKTEEDVKLKIFWVQCISLLFLAFIISLALNLFQFNPIRLILEVILILSIFIIFTISYKSKKLNPYHYIILLISNLFIMTLLLILDQMSKITIFSYASLNILFTVILFDKMKRFILLILQSVLYVFVIIYLLSSKDANIVVYNMTIQILISTFTTVSCFLTILKMYENNVDYLQAINKQLKRTALKDSLTNLWNREYMNLLLDEILESSRQLSIIMFDIDYFKKVNDTYGHIVGDKLLKKFAHILSNNLPKNSHAIRYVGEEFLVVLPEKNAKDAYELANKIRKKVENELKIKEIKGKITISGGVQEYNKKMTKSSLINEADKNLYVAKESGRNRIIV